MSDIRMNDVSFYYPGNNKVLHGINFKLTRETTAIVGQNGAGKTTFVKLLKGLLTPTEGTVSLNNVNIHDKYTIAKLARHIGYVFQNPNDQIFKNSVLREVMFGPLNIGQKEMEAKKNAVLALKKVGLEQFQHYNPYDMSLSERKMIAIASILAMDTDIVIFDEPTMGQDAKGKKRLKKIIHDLKQDGKCVICILHDMDFAAEVFERTVVLYKGTVLMDDSTREVFSHFDIIKEAHLEKPHVMKMAEQLGIKKVVLSIDELMEILQGRTI
ncbi:MAG TPA: ABC transporter ATP-binding protein [Bacillota bacterium]|nr:ABC transporter ATP-binding protein [Bacillota bacterium]